eukprot:TRINITY_DN20066_c0_g1_i2.p1 TRINITY_DN20066_c0_g1~~TRINITY_DN20066_c0_g1_i2.p1  ORF type:complete len:434 (-),score=70.61 TRINITY_DN20066_c0_g1_i2:188-1489(-)
MTLRGKRYGCASDTAAGEERRDLTESNATITELMAPLNQSGCLQHDAGWWKMEFCADKHVRQFHAAADEKGNVRIEQVHYLGRFRTQDALQPSPKPKLVAAKTRSYLWQKYTNGSVCDLTNEPRETTILYVCEPGLPRHKWTLKVEEKVSCKYEAVVSTSLPCPHPLFAQERNQAASDPKHFPPIQISCSLFVSAPVSRFESPAKWQLQSDLQDADIPTVSQMKVVDCRPSGACALTLSQLTNQGRLKSLRTGLGFVWRRPDEGPEVLLAGFGSGPEFGLGAFRVWPNGTLEGEYSFEQAGGRVGREVATPVHTIQDELTGVYHIKGTQPVDEAHPRSQVWGYDGLLRLKQAGAGGSSYECTWVVGKTSYSGIGILTSDGAYLVAAFGDKSMDVAEYRMSGQELVGSFATANETDRQSGWAGNVSEQVWIAAP